MQGCIWEPVGANKRPDHQAVDANKRLLEGEAGLQGPILDFGVVLSVNPTPGAA